ncbi:MAG: hypothetical protein FWE95_02725 [Planctomycetaceae bacterium]|nr:hypothetical protein [Planctomycetaceae bacterium]
MKSKLTRLRQMYFKLPSDLRSAFRELVLHALSDNDRLFLRSASSKISQKIDRWFYTMLERYGKFDRTLFWFFGMSSQLGQHLKHNVLRLK